MCSWLLYQCDVEPDLQLDMPKNVAYNEGLTGTCVAKNSLISPHVIVNKDFKSNCHIASRNKIQKGSTCQTTFELSDVNGTCVVRCFLFRARVEGTVIPVISQGVYKMCNFKITFIIYRA